MAGPSLPIGIVGNGAIGNLLAWHCHQQALPYCLLPRSSAPLKLSVTTLAGDTQTLEPDVCALDTAPPLSLLVFPLKAYQIEAALNALPSRFGVETPLMLLHNGMGTLEVVDALRPHNPVIMATTSMGAMKPSPTQCVLTGEGNSFAGWHRKSKNDPEMTSLVDAMLPGVIWHQDIEQVLWDKLAINAVINPLTAAYHMKNGELLAAGYQDEIAALCQETAAVMTAMGLTASQDVLRQNVLEVCERTAANQSSMLQDVMNQRPTELAFINGYLLNQAKRLGIPCPAHQRAVSRLAN